MEKKIKQLGKKILALPVVDDKLGAFYRRPYGLSRRDVESVLANSNVHLFSKPKTGTSYICNILAFYKGIRLGVENLDFSSIGTAGVARDAGSEIGEFRDILEFSSKHRDVRVIQTHHHLPNANPCLVVTTSRDVYDYVISFYHYFYKNRRANTLKLKDVLEPIVSIYTKTHADQQKSANTIAKHVHIQYEDLISQPVATMHRCLELIYATVDERILEKSVELASVNSFATFEKSVGTALAPKGHNFVGESFIRSGVIGEGIKEIGNDESAYIEKRLREAKVPLNGQIIQHKY